MSVKNLSIVVVGHQPFIRHITKEGEFPGVENDLLFTSISQTYLPLLNLLEKLESENIESKFSLVLTPVLCAMLDDKVLQNQYVEWLDRCIELGTREVERLANDSSLLKNAKSQLEKAEKNKKDFTEKYDCNLLKHFSAFARKGKIELLASAGTYSFLPHYADMSEVLNAQIETGIFSHKHYFGTMPDGFWLPYMGFTNGLERTLRSYGINYTILDSHGLLFSENAPETGIFVPLRCWNSLVLFGNDRLASEKVNGKDGYRCSGVYRNQNKDIGFELDSASLGGFIKEGSCRSATLFRYWNNEENASGIYDEQKAIEQAKLDARAFYSEECEKLQKAGIYAENTNLVCAFEASSLGQTWAEGMDFFEELLRQTSDVKFVTPASLISEQFKLAKVTPYPSAASGTGYGEDLLDSSNSWMLRYTRKMCERMIDLSGRFPEDTGLKVRLLVLGAKELLLAMSAELSKMIHDGFMSEYAKKSFENSVLDFTRVFDALGSNTVSTEWLTNVEREHNLFPWLNYRIFCKKK